MESSFAIKAPIAELVEHLLDISFPQSSIGSCLKSTQSKVMHLISPIPEWFSVLLPSILETLENGLTLALRSK
ncbi:hypothetical protein PoB_000753000 [Plakobranchus ocellatus]|uniref:Uncharacterized protein n=1 Tax=Plakobranchus ocellatus TaxID=259542 RepID=A0AAV3YET3_9GAST|nr:hypothetical protein PoB_000753000 [Plakobranchus ocellatus]